MSKTPEEKAAKAAKKAAKLAKAAGSPDGIKKEKKAKKEKGLAEDAVEALVKAEKKAKKAKEEAPASADSDSGAQEEATDDGFKVHKYVPPPEPEDETLQCRDCGADFIFTIGEQEFFKAKGFDNKKTRCAECTAAKKARFGEGGGGKGGGRGKGGADWGGGGGRGGGKGGGRACYNCGEEAIEGSTVMASGEPGIGAELHESWRE
jgi:hypothetical protein